MEVRPLPEHLVRYAESEIARLQVPGAAIGVLHDGVIYAAGVGITNVEHPLPVTPETLFQIGSTSKTFTATALMSLVEAGRVDLDATVRTYLPWFALQSEVDAAKLTVRNLVTHHAGYVGDYFKDTGRGDDAIATIVRKMANSPQLVPAGYTFSYSNAAFYVTGHIVETVHGRPFEHVIRDTIFEPLGMSDTSFFVAPEKTHRLAANYERQRDKTLRLIDDPPTSTYLREPAFFSGGAGLTSTTADYLRFCEMLRRGGELDGARVLGRRTIELMTKNHLPGGASLAGLAIGAFSETAYDGVGFGLGFAMTLSDVATGTPGLGEYYWGGAASTIFWIDPKEDLVVIFMTQLMPSATFNFRGQLKTIIYGAMTD